MQGRTAARAGALAVVAALVTAAPAMAADITVTGIGDDINASCTPDGLTCQTLRAALASATDLPGATIHVPAGPTQLGGTLTVNSQVTIVGVGARSTTI